MGMNGGKRRGDEGVHDKYDDGDENVHDGDAGIKQKAPKRHCCDTLLVHGR